MLSVNADIAIERIAININDYTTADNDGNLFLQDEKIIDK